LWHFCGTGSEKVAFSALLDDLATPFFYALRRIRTSAMVSAAAAFASSIR
jgi:hypothetical protein